MTWRISLWFIFFLTISSCRSTEEEKVHSIPKETSGYYRSERLIEIHQLKRIQKEGAVTIIDFRKSEEYNAGHIPEALNIWRTAIEDASYPYKGMSASNEAIEKLFSTLGIQSDDTIVIYDNKGLCDAARLWWVLKNFNFKKVSLLNGGWLEWKEMNGEISMETPKIVPSSFTFNSAISNEYQIHKEELETLITSEELVLLDTRTADEFSGKRQKSGAKRAGRIPNSHHIDWMNAMDMKQQKFKSRAQLEEIFTQLGVSKDKTIVTYCHTGVRSAHTTFVLTQLLGYTNVKNYDGSWSEWSYFEKLPIEKDSITTVFN